ncbi:MAG TPA: hypothetical protein VL443_24000 [Cyclobacteriaceae bacterium]|jgi:hypothetical protein|nr:hypothetical protein [Cyclobacteriaceae bacterium]
MVKRRVRIVVDGKRYEPVMLAPHLRDSRSIVVSESFKPKDNERRDSQNN